MADSAASTVDSAASTVDSAAATADDSATTPTPIGVKLGSARTVFVYADEDGDPETVQTRSCLAVPENSNQFYYGEDAEAKYPDKTMYFLDGGVPGDAERAELTERFFTELCEAHDLPADSAVVFAIPAVDDDCGLANFNTMVDASDIGDAVTRGFPESLCGSIPAVGDDLSAIDQIFAAINLGATTLEASGYRHGERLAPFSTAAATGNDVDQAIVDAIDDETDGRVELARTTAREYKETYADFDSFEPFTDVFDHPEEGEQEFTVERGLMGPLDAYLDDVVDELTTGFFSRLATQHMRSYQLSVTRPLVVTGGMACIPGLADELASRLSEELDRDVTAVTADHPEVAAAEGAYRLAERLAATR
ncbi:hypothetical protein GJR96_14420 [Haloferax sp. MBLA0076]|uniref:Actin-like ATPase involved in cell morphogenesis n=1 Tax=Haloferax litoreum TaxID=2666140 RepID=A0A6A8GJI5_9EURY|nr:MULTISPECIES: hypothetical protein [Haloferax]KAB1194875.1 hypothetical protein Hfx1148_14350 [Haloferax sp. CBA1148]MRX23146.1 hypothetical protein [Haloferax litoreum]